MVSELVLPGRVQILTPKLWLPAQGMEQYFDALEDEVVDFFKKFLHASGDKEKQRGILQMAGSLAFYSSKKIQDLLFGATAYTAVTPQLIGLWAAALDDTFNGATASEAAYTSYARLSLTNNTTIFAAGSGTTTYTKTYPSDAAKTWATSTGTGTNNTITYMGQLDGNLHTSADNGIAWCSVTSTTINNGDTPQLAQNAVTVTQD